MTATAPTKHYPTQNEFEALVGYGIAVARGAGIHLCGIHVANHRGLSLQVDTAADVDRLAGLLGITGVPVVLGAREGHGGTLFREGAVSIPLPEFEGCRVPVDVYGPAS